MIGIELRSKGSTLHLKFATIKPSSKRGFLSSLLHTTIQIQDPIAWIQSLENYFYLAVGIPKVIASPDGLSEGSSKVGYLMFEPIYSFRQILLEADIWNQLNLQIKFNRPPSLQDNIQSNEAKNTSQTGFQPGDMQVGMSNE